MATFKELYTNMKPGPSREALIYQYAIQQGKPKLLPITVPGPNNTKITYQVMPDFLMIDGIRVTLTPTTAQRIADAFGMQIPTAKMADQIYQSSNKIPARPLSGSGVTIDGRHYSGDEVTRNLISDSRANIAYSDIVNQQIAQQKNLNPNKPVDGFNKSIVQSEAPGRTGYYGLWTGNSSNEPLQGGNGVTRHDLNQTEYCAGLRLVSNDVVITKPDGTVINTNLPKLLRTKSLSSSVSFAPGKGVQRYNETKAGPPPGYRGAKIDPADKNEAEAIAKSLLGRPMWTELPITLKNGKQYIARVEPHSNKPKGVSLYESISGTTPTTPSKPTSEPMQVAKAPTSTTVPSTSQSIMQRVTDFIDTVSRSIG